ncbi:hypothetical protein [Vibrio hepatarius]|uniref:hypothetical protein n=1 Tax=Vibrio hepatarius TaxID=171383 RepID=UPI001C08EC61|nr:hypothetical protein [Vibrio hepatarius]MBU2895573.1 hypothetical protein [Vibrio hepatarius]
MTDSTSETSLPEDSFGQLDITYDQTPWYRRRWFLCVTMLFFIPLTLILVLSGEVYLKRQGVVYKMQLSQKIRVVIACLVLLCVGLFRVIGPGY